MTTTNDTLLCCISRCDIEAQMFDDHRLEYAKLATACWEVLANREDALFNQHVCMSNIRAWMSAYAQSHNLEERW